MRGDMKVKKWVDVAGSSLSFIGFCGIAGASEGRGSLLLAIIVFAIGISEVIWSYQR